MEQSGLVKNLSGTICVLGLALTTMNMNMNNTIIVSGNYDRPQYDSIKEDFLNICGESVDNIYVNDSSTSQLWEEANSLFGQMREATEAERLNVNDYIRSISRDTGVEFFSIC